MQKSNICIKSNIQLRHHESAVRDVEYARHITGPERLRQMRLKLDGTTPVRLTDLQEEILRNINACTLAKNGETTHGPIIRDGELRWSCRCEQKECKNYYNCMNVRFSKVIHREEKQSVLPEESAPVDLDKILERFGILRHGTSIESIRHPLDKPRTEETEIAYTEPTEPVVTPAETNQFHVIEHPQAIIEAPLDSHILLNSGPGTGKTYTIIQRLIWLLRNALCAPEEIYILCYTRSAKKVVEQQIDLAVQRGELSVAAKNICILTFDAYASYFLMELKDDINVDFSGYDYNQRIRLFNQHISAEDFAHVRYFIVDEIQDLVNERAEMVLSILKYLQCGYLLAGDRCQSIYDYEADENATLDSEHFYQQLRAQLPQDTLYYEIGVNRRQTAALAEQAHSMRQVLLHKSIAEQNAYAAEVMKQYAGGQKIETYIRELTNLPDVSTAILCRNNGEAEYISTLLCRQKIPHTLNRGVNHAQPLPRWIADVLWDYCNDTIGQADFTERFIHRVKGDYDPERIWQQLCSVTKTAPGMPLSITVLLSAMSVTNNIPDLFYETAPLLTVSTIHKAKGSEFEHVILIDSDIPENAESAEEARVRYVALTRPKQQLITMRKSRTYFRRIGSGRVIQTGIHNVYKKCNRYCSNIAVGLSGDVNCNSFAAGAFADVLALQQYIAEHVKQYDPLQAVRSEVTGNYEIYHQDRKLGELSETMLTEIGSGVEATDYRFNLPHTLTGLYVSSITSEILRKYDEAMPEEFRKSRICYGIQVTGLAKLNFK